jgi:hypothetical protein
MNYSVEQNAWEGNSWLANQENTHLLWNMKVYCCIHKSSPLAFILSQMSPVHTTPLDFCKILFITIFP